MGLNHLVSAGGTRTGHIWGGYAKRELLKTLKAKIVIQMLPPHRHDCVLIVNKSLVVDGKELLSRNRSRLDIPLSSITDLHLGFDDVFVGKDSKGKKYRLEPIRMSYRENAKIRTIYIFAEYKGLFRSSSEAGFKLLKSTVSAWTHTSKWNDLPCC